MLLCIKVFSFPCYGKQEPEYLSQYSDEAGRPGFDSWQGQRYLLFSIVSRPTLGPNESPIQWVPLAVSLGIKRTGC